MISIQYIPLSVRVRAWSSSLLSAPEINSLVSKDLQSIISYVSTKDKNISKNDNSVEFLQSLQQSIFHYIQTGLRISSAEGHHFIRELSRESEVENLKLMVKMLCSGKFQGDFLPAYDSFHISEKKLLEIRTFSDLISLLRGTIYEPILTSLNRVEQEQNSLYWELALDNLYTHRLYINSKRLDIQSEKAIKKLLIIPIMLEQLISIYRYRFHFQTDPNDILLYVPNITHILTMEEWKKFIYAPTSSDFIQYLIDHNFCDNTVADNASELRLYFRKKLEKSCRITIRKQMTGISSFIAFIQLKKIQVQKITTITASKSLRTFQGDLSMYL